jgi:flagellar biosynthesis anti-sigma factor FlgM
MRINQTNSSPVQANDAGSTKKSDRVKTEAYEKSSGNAAVSKRSDSASAQISSKARDMAQAKQVATDTPDVRESKIAALREQIQNKKYHVSASDISDRLVDDHLRLAGS